MSSKPKPSPSPKPAESTKPGPKAAPESLDQLKQLGKYHIERKIGAGGMGAVYLATDTQLKRIVALKVLPADKAQNPTLVRRFQAEAHAAAALKHDNIVVVYEAGEVDGFNYMALEFVDGMDVSNLVHKRGVVPVKRSIDMIRQVARALQHAHAQGIVHRDIKPANLLIRRDGLVKLADMGLARSLDEAADTGITRAGTTVGTVDYMSPEQARDSKAADVRSDIYSLGCTWYHMLTGGPPYPDGSLTNKLRAHAESPPPDPRLKNPNVPEGVVAILNRMLAKDPRQRYQTPAELLKELQTTNLDRDAVSVSVLSDLAADESGKPQVKSKSKPRVVAGVAQLDLDSDDEVESPSNGAPSSTSSPERGKLPPRPDEANESSYKAVVFYGGLSVAGLAVIVGLGMLVKELAPDAPSESSTNPFADRSAAIAKTVPTEAGNEATRPTASEAEPTTAATAPPPPRSVPSQIKKPVESLTREQEERRALPAWVVQPSPLPGNLRTVPVRGQSTDENYFASLNLVLDTAGEEGAVIDLQGRGPFVLYADQPLKSRRLVIRGSDSPGEEPIVVVLPRLRAAPVKTVLSAGAIELELRNIHFLIDAEKFPQSESTLLTVAGGLVRATNCSVDVTGKGPPWTFLRLEPGPAGFPASETPTHVLLQDSLFRGASLTLLNVALPQADLVVWNVLAVSGSVPTIQLGGRLQELGQTSGQHLFLTSATIAASHTAIDIGGDPDPPVPHEIHIHNSVLGLAESAPDASLLRLSGWTPAQARGAFGRVLKWTSKGDWYAGWPTLIRIDPEGFVAAASYKDWDDRWRSAEIGPITQFSSAPWPDRSLADPARIPLDQFDPRKIAALPASRGALNVPGCPIARLHTVSLDNVGLVADRAARTRPPASLFPTPARTLRVDLAKDDLGRFLTSQTLVDATEVVVSGHGLRACSPFTLQNVRVRLVFQSTDEQHPLVLTPRLIEGGRPTGAGARDDALISVINGGLELVDGAFTVPASEKLPLPRWFVQAIDSDLALRQCRVQGPLSGTTRNKGLIQWVRGGATGAGPRASHYEHYLACVDTFLLGAGTLIEAEAWHRAIYLRNTLGIARDELLALDLRGPDATIRGVLDIDQCTLSAGEAVFRVTASDTCKDTEDGLQAFIDLSVLGPPLRTGSQKPTPTLLRYAGRLLEPPQVKWWESHNGYVGFKNYLKAADVAATAEPQKFDAWLAAWGSDQVIKPLFEPGAVLLKDEVPDRSKLEPSDFQLHPRCKAAAWSEDQRPIGVNFSAFRVPEIRSRAAAPPPPRVKPGRSPMPPPIGF